jgi:superfamily II DNA or RNA helicase
MASVFARPEQGQLVDVRQRRYLVAEIAKSGLPLDITDVGNGDHQHLVTLTSIEDDALGEELQVIWEIEPGTRVAEKAALPEPTGFDEPRRLDAFLDAVRWGASSSADVRALLSPFRSGIEIEDYQLDPVIRAIQMPRANLLVADDVGLGKTIESGLVVQELILRHRVRTVLVVCPAALQIQWRDQMRDKFGLEFRIVDTGLMKELRRQRGLHVNPWTHFPRLITSIDFLKRDRPMRLFSEVLPSEGESAYPRRFDLMIVDEAHNIAPSGRGRYATDSQRTQAIRRLTPHFEHKLFLSATPHNGYPESFTALLELLDSQRFARGVAPDRDQLAAIMVRRLKSELPTRWDGTPRFPRRVLVPLEVNYSEEERHIHKLLQRYSKARQHSATDPAEKYATEFVLKLLKKRLFSSPEAFAKTLAQHEQSIQNARRRKAVKIGRPTIGILRRQIEQVDEEFGDDAVAEDVTGDAVETATRLFHDLTAEQESLVAEMRTWAERARKYADSKTDCLIQWLKTNIKPNGQWSKERVIIFTEYRDTQKWLQQVLTTEGLAGSDRLMTLYGGMDAEGRERIKAAFQADPALSPVRILLATDAASEGIDLQNHCSQLIHFEIPWNPNRMEQRNGRIDRHGQRAPTVQVYHFVGAGYNQNELKVGAYPGELEGDLEFLMRAALKVNNIREDLGKVGPVIAEQVEEAMLGRRTQLDTTSAERESEGVRRMLRFERKLREQIEALHEQLQESRRELRVSPENIQSVVQIALELAGQPPLRPTEVEGLWPDPTGQSRTCPVFELPALRGSWAACSQGLEHPHTRQVRPIVFDHDLAKGRDDVVLVHLNHRLVQMALRLLRAEIWSPPGLRKLYRVTSRLVPNSVLDTPAVIAHARLMITSSDNQRLHEEIISAGGFFREGRFARMNVGEVQRALEGAGVQLGSTPAPPAMNARLTELWPSHEQPLYQALEARMRDRFAGLQKQLADRAEKEVKDITAILTELWDSIMAEVNKLEQPIQLELFNPTERDQFERDRMSLRIRAEQIPHEIEQESGAIRARFVDPQAHLFPVAITYLVPERIAREMEGGH